jgi:rhodanese-related sulfurtransferase
MRKVTLPIALALTLALAFAACERTDEAGGTNTGQPAATTQTAATTQPSAPASPAPAVSPPAGALPAASPSPTAQAPEMPALVARRIPVDEARAAFERREAVFVDVRNEEIYRTGHLPGAILVPVDTVAQNAQKLPRNKFIITYCS